MFDPIFTEQLHEIYNEKQKLVNHYNKFLLQMKKKINKEQIKDICEEEKKHLNILKNINLKMLEGQVSWNEKPCMKEECSGRLQEKIIYSEIKIIKVVKELLVNVQDIRIKNGLYYIFTDDQRHIDTVIFLNSLRA